MASLSETVRGWLYQPLTDRLTALEARMADQSAQLTAVAQDMARLAPAIADLLTENTRLAARNAELEGEDAAETAAGNAVREQWNAIAGQFTAAPELPDVPEVPEAPAEPTEPAPAEGDTTV